jgi:hypothetical protein
MFESTSIQFNEPVWHPQPYLHPQLQVKVERDFYDRAEETRQAETALKFSSDRRAVVIIGDRRSGKTSLLWQLDHRLNTESSGEFISIVPPWQGIHTCQNLFEEILRSLERKLPLDADLVWDEPVSKEPTTAAMIEQLQHRLIGFGSKTLIIGLDEFDSIIQEDLTTMEEKHKILRLMAGLLEANDLPIKLLLTMTQAPAKFQVMQASGLSAQAALIRLRPFSRSDLNEMLTGILGADALLSQHESDQIYQLSGGWPYFAKLLLSSMTDLPPGEQLLEQAVKKAVSHPIVNRTLQNLYEVHFDQDAKRIMLLLARRNNRLGPVELAALGPWASLALEDLQQRHLVRQQSDGTFAMRVGLLSRWFCAWPRFEQEIDHHLVNLKITPDET